jgi:hypothetical protein
MKGKPNLKVAEFSASRGLERCLAATLEKNPNPD